MKRTLDEIPKVRKTFAFSWTKCDSCNCLVKWESMWRYWVWVGDCIAGGVYPCAMDLCDLCASSQEQAIKVASKVNQVVMESRRVKHENGSEN